ncbi:MAG: uroporphyrinogen-III synthase [Prevotella sp.]|nr:uroporphyrinogen-III synthase [Prevotella sp.]MDE6151070.1 uroporphyrinogen-III synthase [Prevotella sp.]
MIKKILVSQPRPSGDKSPYFDIERDYGVEFVFRPFIKVEGISSKDFRQQHVSLGAYTAVVFTSKYAIDNYFSLAKELRVEIPETMKYFCTTESIAHYIQKYVQYRKRKVFFGESGRVDDLIPAMLKHSGEKYLVPLSSVHNNAIKDLLDRNNLQHTECVMYQTVNDDLTEEEKENFDFDMIILFSPTGVKTLHDNLDDKVKDGSLKVATFGTATAKAAEEQGYDLEVQAPTPKQPSMVGALRAYLRDLED